MARKRVFRTDEEVLDRAAEILRERDEIRDPMNSPMAVRSFLTLRYAALQHEVFTVLWLDSQNRLIDVEDMFRGTLAQTSVYPREIVKRALQVNAAAVIFAHNHPSGVAEPSRADELLTQSLKSALAMVDVRTLDHIVTGGGSAISFAERGMI
jgi:DNA repair protein RadC